MSARELLSLPPAEWEQAIELMSWRELRAVAEKMTKAARRVDRLRRFALEAARTTRETARRGGTLL